MIARRYTKCNRERNLNETVEGNRPVSLRNVVRNPRGGRHDLQAVTNRGRQCPDAQGCPGTVAVRRRGSSALPLAAAPSDAAREAPTAGRPWGLAIAARLVPADA